MLLRLNNHMFFFQWQMLYAATNPKQIKDRWQVDGVDWTREQHSHLSEHYSMHLHVHRLTCQRGSKIDWQLMVVVEEWWGPYRAKVIRSTNWSKAIVGDPKKITAWMKKQDVKRQSLQDNEAVPLQNGDASTKVLQ